MTSFLNYVTATLRALFAQLASCVLTLVQCICYFEYYPRRTSVNFVLKIKRSRSLGYFNAPDLKGPPGASSNRIVHLCVCLSVCLSGIVAAGGIRVSQTHV